MDISRKVIKNIKDEKGFVKKDSRGDYLFECYNYGKKNCTLCGGLGFYLIEYEPQQGNEMFTLCGCISKSCEKKCNNKPPYMIYNISKNKMIDCSCRPARILKKKLEESFKKSNIPQHYCYKTFEMIDRTVSEDLSLDVAIEWLDEFVNKWDEIKINSVQKKGFYLWGTVGVGKTLLACITLNELIFRYQVSCKYAKINKDFLDAIKNTFSDKDTEATEGSIQAELSNVEILVLDDFGVHKETDWSNSQLYNLIDARYEKNKITIITSNHSMMDWKDKNEGRVYSRLCQMSNEIQIESEDYRAKFLVQLSN